MGATDSKRRHARIAALVGRKPSIKQGKLAAGAAAAGPGDRARTPVGSSRQEEGSSGSSSSLQQAGEAALLDLQLLCCLVALATS